jgi:hypothetical protein
MDRKEKKAIHLEITTLLDGNCAGCEYRSLKNSENHCKNYCQVGKELIRLSSLLMKEPTVKEEKTIQEEIVDPFKKGRWSKDEELYLINHAKIFKHDHLAKRLNRSPRDVYNKLYHLRVIKKVSS